MIDNETISAELTRFKQKIKKNSIVIILICSLFWFILSAYFIIKAQSSNQDIKEIKKENKMLVKQMDSLNHRYTEDSSARAAVIQEQEYYREQRRLIMQDISSIETDLTKYKQQYAKVNNYKNVTVDSVTKLFNNRFDY